MICSINIITLFEFLVKEIEKKEERGRIFREWGILKLRRSHAEIKADYTRRILISYKRYLKER